MRGYGTSGGSDREREALGLFCAKRAVDSDLASARSGEPHDESATLLAPNDRREASSGEIIDDADVTEVCARATFDDHAGVPSPTAELCTTDIEHRETEQRRRSRAACTAAGRRSYRWACCSASPCTAAAVTARVVGARAGRAAARAARSTTRSP
jgi:hypothetical protein